MKKEFIVCVSHFIRGKASSEQEAREKIKTIMEEQINDLKEEGYAEGKEWNPDRKMNIGVFKKDHNSKIEDLTDTVSIEMAW